MKSVLIAGISGNLGTNLARNLSREGFIVFGLSRSTNPPRSPFVKRIYTNNEISKSFKNNQIDFVINAACCYGRANETDYEMLNGNFFFQLTLLKHAIEFSSKFINITSVVHPSANLYGYTKDIFTDSLNRIGKLNLDFSYVNIFLENIYGPNESKDKFIKSMLSKLKNDHVIYLSKGWQKRDFLYLTDAVKGITQVILNFEKLQGNFFMGVVFKALDNFNRPGFIACGSHTPEIDHTKRWFTESLKSAVKNITKVKPGIDGLSKRIILPKEGERVDLSNLLNISNFKPSAGYKFDWRDPKNAQQIAEYVHRLSCQSFGSFELFFNPDIGGSLENFHSFWDEQNKLNAAAESAKQEKKRAEFLKKKIKKV